MDISKGRYWDRAWSLIDGCTPCSPGCDHCWSASMTHRYKRSKRIGQDAPGVPHYTNDKGQFIGKVATRPDRLDIPLKRRKPTVWAIWNDLFHEDVPDEFIAQAYAYMWLSGPDSWIADEPQKYTGHTFLVLTKRAERMASLMASASFWEKVVDSCALDCRAIMPVSYIYHGLTICNQEEAYEKLPIFLQVPGKKFLSIEPMLGAININYALPRTFCTKCGCSNLGETEFCTHCGAVPYKRNHGIDAVILGGETGPGARPLHPDWVRSVRDQCAAAGVPFFLKSGMGKRKNYWSNEIKEWGNMNDRLWGCLEDGHIDNFPLWRMIDGRTHDDLPWREHD